MNFTLQEIENWVAHFGDVETLEDYAKMIKSFVSEYYIDTSEQIPVDASVSPLPCNAGRLDQAKRFALMNFDKWNDTTGFAEPHSSYYYEVCSCIEDAVEFGFGVAHGQSWKEIVKNIRKNEAVG